MKRILLLGAGFSRNWGGWLASEFIGELCGRVAARPSLGHNLRVLKNFEQALEERRGHADYARKSRAAVIFPYSVGDGDDEISKISEAIMPQPIGDVLWLERAIRLTFRDMNTVFANLQGLSLSGDPGDKSVDKFLAAFDAIFTLNQDLLLEFADGGRVWADTTTQPALDGDGLGPLAGLKYGVGGGVRFQSGSAFVLRADVAWSPDATPIAAYVAAGQMF